MKPKHTLIATMACIGFLAHPLCAEAKSSSYAINIDAVDAVTALNSLALQTEHLLVFDYDQVKDIRVPPLNGFYTLQQALDLILKDTGLAGSLSRKEVISIAPSSNTTKFQEEPMNIKSTKQLLLSGATAAAIIASPQIASAQTQPELLVKPPTQTVNEIGDEIITIGTRRANRTVLDSPVPIDVFDVISIESVAAADLNDILDTLIPSFSISRSDIADGLSLSRLGAVRGLDGDKILVLVNGKRRHRDAHVNLFSGPHGPDIASIPSIALKSVEVLRDGASAQYGSDAIAGVLNFSLRDDTEGGEIRTRYGKFYEGDGENIQLEATLGLPLGENGFFNVSGEYVTREKTSRGGRYIWNFNSNFTESAADSAAAEQDTNGDGIPDRFGPDELTAVDVDGDGDIDTYIVGSDGVRDDPDRRFADNLRIPEMRFGQPSVDSIRGFINSGYDFNDETSAYLFANYSTAEVETDFFYRATSFGQFRLTRNSDGTIFNPRSLYPSGFIPAFSSVQDDYSVTGGLKGQFGNRLNWDISIGYGANEIDYEISNTFNPSLGVASPTTFKPGGLKNSELGINADFSFEVDNTWFASPLNIAFGAEYRNEKYEIIAGEESSYIAGPFAARDPFNFEITQAEVDADPNDLLTQIECRIPGLETIGSLCPTGDPINNIASVGSNGFAGFLPSTADDTSRDIFGFYVDLEADITDKFLTNLTARYSDYSDFGDNFSVKLAGRYELSNNIALRGSIGTGFKAPTIGQQATNNVSTRLDNNSQPILSGIFPITNPVSQFFGAQPLTPEKSFQISTGAIFTPLENLTITLDYYNTRIEDRLGFSGRFNVTPAARAILEAEGIPGAGEIAQVRFYTNDYDTRNQGIDVVATYNLDWNKLGHTKFSFGANWNDAKVTSRVPRFFDNVGRLTDEANDADGQPSFILDDRSVEFIERGAIDVSGNLSATHTIEAWQIMARANFWGPYNRVSNDDQKFGSEVQIDMEASYQLTDMLKLSVGAQNIFDNLPDRLTEIDQSGSITFRGFNYIPGLEARVPWQGGFWYTRLGVKF